MITTITSNEIDQVVGGHSSDAQIVSVYRESVSGSDGTMTRETTTYSDGSTHTKTTYTNSKGKTTLSMESCD